MCVSMCEGVQVCLCVCVSGHVVCGVCVRLSMQVSLFAMSVCE